MAAQPMMPMGAHGGVPIIPGRGRFQWNVPMGPKAEYTFKGYHVTGVPHPVYPWPESDVRLIRNYYDPDYVPLTRVMVYQTAAGATLSFLHHGIARYDPDAKGDPMIERVEMPTGRYGASFRRPNVMERWFENKQDVRPYSKRALYQLPPPTRHYRGDWLVDWVATNFWDAAWEDKREFSEAKEREEMERKDKRREFEQEEADHAARGESNYFAREFEKIGSEERKEVIARQTGQWKEPTRPSVDLGSIRRDRIAGEQS